MTGVENHEKFSYASPLRYSGGYQMTLRQLHVELIAKRSECKTVKRKTTVKYLKCEMDNEIILPFEGCS